MSLVICLSLYLVWSKNQNYNRLLSRLRAAKEFVFSLRRNRQKWRVFSQFLSQLDWNVSSIVARFPMSLSSFFTTPHTCFCSRLTTLHTPHMLSLTREKWTDHQPSASRDTRQQLSREECLNFPIVMPRFFNWWCLFYCYLPERPIAVLLILSENTCSMYNLYLHPI